MRDGLLDGTTASDHPAPDVVAAVAAAATDDDHSDSPSDRHSPPEKQAADDTSLGAKTISMFGSIVLNVNNLCGPGMLLTPLVYQQAGWTMPTVLLIVLCVISSFACLSIIEAIRLIPGNERFEKRIEFSTVVHHYYGHRAYIVCQVLYALSLQTLNIASIIACTQVMDQFFVFAFGKSFALQFSPSFGFISTPSPVCLQSPWSESGVILTLGYLVVMATCMPLGFLNLDQNIVFQYASFSIFCAIFVEFLVQFFRSPLDTAQTPARGTDMTEALGQLLINFTFVTTIPSWLNEKRPDVSIPKAVWASTIPCSVAYVVMGLFGAMAYPNLSPDNANILNVMAADGHASMLTKVSVYIFSFGVVGLGVPLFSVVVRYNLYVGKVFSARWSAFWGVIFPWLISFLLYQGNGFEQFVTWASLALNGFINFLLPFALLITARRRHGPGSTADTTDAVSAPGSAPATVTVHASGAAVSAPVAAGAAAVRVKPVPVRVLGSSIQSDAAGSASNAPLLDAAAKRLGGAEADVVVRSDRNMSLVSYDSTGVTGAGRRKSSAVVVGVPVADDTAAPLTYGVTSGGAGDGDGGLTSPDALVGAAGAAARERDPPSPPAPLWLLPLARVLAVAITGMLVAAIGLEIYTDATTTDSGFVCQTWVH